MHRIANRKLGDVAGLDDCMAALKDCQRLLGTPLELEAQRLETEAKSLCFPEGITTMAGGQSGRPRTWAIHTDTYYTDLYRDICNVITLHSL